MPGKQTIDAVPLLASQDSECITKARSALLLGASTPAGEKRGVVNKQGVFVPSPLDGIGRIGYDEFKGLIIPMQRIGQRVIAGDVKLIVAHIMQEHIDAAQVIGGDVDFLPVVADTDALRPQNLGGLQQQGARAAGRVYKNAVFDTNRKSLLRHTSAEKDLK